MPIFLYLIVAIFIIVKRQRKPNLNYKMFVKGTSIMCIAFFFFKLGLDDNNDYLRIYHGMWHLTVGFASFYNW